MTGVERIAVEATRQIREGKILIQLNRFFFRVMYNYRVTYVATGLCLIARIFEGLAWFFLRVSNMVLDLHYEADYQRMEFFE